MKKKVRMTCVLKSGAIVKEAVWVDPKDNYAMTVILQMKTALENSIDYAKPNLQNITFGHTTIAVSEIAAITIK